ncbi:hypothetical protein SC738_08885 [Legionella pneumophila serogroup 1]|uniref:hypothetical protein n=1 Tax=Legionella pneumophila TaxID=446 RepID=UPI000770A6DC|nr:hypothetical protein [Legionella pneumophila]HAT8823140.1 hypothetical protein [Legionella pneumophila subsp. pneumophila]MCZ4737888.1 hypothetical protein [Legionella pneumophila]MCZ4747423.1 hypothetical protein [Legionella pneumophila]MDI9828436.1 hypothetical protein [Legionella pneumophila]MDO5157994.1 hypothetical protein [Legionella pneumophila]
MIIKINDNIKIWKEFNPFELHIDENLFNSTGANRNLAKLGINKERIEIKNRWFDVLTSSELVRKRNKSDGYYRVVYIQINMENGEYYIGKANRPKWSELKRYQGSGLKFVNKFNKNSDQFVRFYIASCETAEETELLESTLVDSELLADEKCLNLVAGGGGTTKPPLIAETSEKKREYMKSHPAQFQPMLEACKNAFQSGDNPSLRARSQRIKEVMSDEKYREMTRERIKNWIAENPDGYAEARKNNHEAIKTSECQAKRKASFDNWVKNNPEEYQAWQKKLISSRTTPEANEKRKASLKEWNEKNPEKANVNVNKRAKAAAEKLSKAVCMIDLQSGDVLNTFPSQHAAAKWLVENGKAKNLNCVSSISSVCLRKPCTTGYGHRKKAYGCGWCFASETQIKD